MKPGKGGQRPAAERTAGLQETDRAARRLFGVNIDQLTRGDRMSRYAAPTCDDGKVVMRHFELLPLAITPLSFGMFAGSAEGALVASAGEAHRLPARELGAPARAVEISAIAFRADAHLHPAALTMVEPVGRRLFEQPQDPLPDGTGQRRGGEA